MSQIGVNFEHPRMPITLVVPVRQLSNFVLAAARGRSSSLQLGVEVILGRHPNANPEQYVDFGAPQITSTPSCSAELLPRAAASTKFGACRTGTARVIDILGRSKSANICKM